MSQAHSIKLFWDVEWGVHIFLFFEFFLDQSLFIYLVVLQPVLGWSSFFVVSYIPLIFLNFCLSRMQWIKSSSCIIFLSHECPEFEVVLLKHIFNLP